MMHARNFCRTFIALIVFVGVTRVCEAQATLSARDSTALVAAVVADLRARYPVFSAGSFVFDSANTSPDPLTARVLAALRSGDTIALKPPTRTTPRVKIRNVSFSGDTAAVTVSVNQCAVEPRERVSGRSGTHRFIRAGERWERKGGGAVAVGDGLRCPH